MLIITGQIIAAVAVLANAVVYGTDVCGAVITRSVYRKLDDAAVTMRRDGVTITAISACRLSVWAVWSPRCSRC
ncbi:hypothetical protein ACFQZZ_04365 [Nocardia sp. GCM10030253]|uniref:hypothetical protein n=1 Tax=Nocardia sp. GCM10030253 TaxID=3273404 RepID=UPI003632CEA4